MASPRKQPTNHEWDLSSFFDQDGNAPAPKIGVALLLDIRTELRRLNKTFIEASIFVNGKVG